MHSVIILTAAIQVKPLNITNANTQAVRLDSSREKGYDAN